MWTILSAIAKNKLNLVNAVVSILVGDKAERCNLNHKLKLSSKKTVSNEYVAVFIYGQQA